MRWPFLTLILFGLQAIPALSVSVRAEDPMEMPPDIELTPNPASGQEPEAALPP